MSDPPGKPPRWPDDGWFDQPEPEDDGDPWDAAALWDADDWWWQPPCDEPPSLGRIEDARQGDMFDGRENL